MSPAGSSSNSMSGDRLTLRPVVTKTFLKGVIAIVVFSVFLDIGPSNFTNYLIFLSISLGALVIYALVKRQSSFDLMEDKIEIKRLFGKSNTVAYRDILDISISQGILARRFKCGTVYLVLKQGRGSVKVMGGGTAEQLQDIPDPNHIFELVSDRLGPSSF